MDPQNKYCIICGRNQDDVRVLHCFPKRPERLRQWGKVLDLTVRDRVPRHWRVCNLHFLPQCYTFEGSLRLNQNALPSPYKRKVPTHIGMDVAIKQEVIPCTSEQDLTAIPATSLEHVFKTGIDEAIKQEVILSTYEQDLTDIPATSLEHVFKTDIDEAIKQEVILSTYEQDLTDVSSTSLGHVLKTDIDETIKQEVILSTSEQDLTAIPSMSLGHEFETVNIKVEVMSSPEVSMQDLISSTSKQGPCVSIQPALITALFRSPPYRRCLFKDMPKFSFARITPRKNNLISVIKKRENQIRKLKILCKQRGNDLRNCKDVEHSGIVKDIFKRLSPIAANFLVSQLRWSHQAPRTRRWTLDDKITALLIFKRSPTCYSLLRRLFSLPCRSSLTALLLNVLLQAGINDNFLQHVQTGLQNRLSVDRICNVMFDDMSNKEHIQYDNSVFCFMH